MDTKKIPLQTIVQTGHSTDVLSLAVCPNSEYLVSTASDSTVKLWELKSGKLIRNFSGHNSWVVACAISSNRKYIATGSWDHTVRLWNLETGEQLQEFEVAGGESVCFSPDATCLYGGSENGEVFLLWDSLSSKRKIPLASSFLGHTCKVKAMCMYDKDDKKYLATGSSDGTAKLWNFETGALLQTYTAHPDDFGKDFKLDPGQSHPLTIRSVCFTPDGKYLVTGCHDGTAKLWDTEARSQTKSLFNSIYFRSFKHSDKIRSVSVSPDGNLLATAGNDNSARLWNLKDLNQQEPVAIFEGEHTGPLTAVKITPDGKWLATGSKDSLVKLWSIETQKVIQVFTGESFSVNTAVLRHDGKYLATGHKNNVIKIWNLMTGKLSKTLRSNEISNEVGIVSGITSLNFSQDDQWLVSGSGDGTAKLWNIENETPLQVFQGQSSFLNSAVISQDNEYIVTGGDTPVISVFNTASEGVMEFEGLTEWVSGVDINTEKGYLVAACDHNGDDTINNIVLWDLNTKKQHVLKGHTERVRSVKMSRNGKFLVSASNDGSAMLWNLENRKKPVQKFIGHTFWVNSVDISADGAFVVTGSDDCTARLWDAKTGKVLKVFEGHSASVTVSITANAKYVITSSRDATTKIWNLESGAEVATLIAVGEEDWVVLTPPGLFDASPGAMQKMHYVMGMEVIELDQLKNRYWEPNLLSILLNFKEGKLKDVDQLTALALYPQIELMELEGALLKVKLQERSGGMGRTSLRINNKERERDINKDRQTSFSIDLKQYEKFFAAGENSITIRCWNEADWLSGPFQERIYLKTGIEDAMPSLYAIFVGTSKYKNERFTLAYPDQDARYISDAVKIVGEQFFKTGEVHIKLLTTEDPSSASFSSKSNIKAAFDEFALQAKTQDVVVFYFSGHGANFDDGKKALYYYLTNEIVSDNFSDSAVREKAMISAEELSDWINAIPAMKQVLILDTCYSGKILDNLKSKSAIDATQEREMERMKDRTGMYVLTGSAADKVSYEANNYGQGLLTYSLLFGMRGAALLKNTNQQMNAVDVMNLFSWSKEQVEDLSKEFDVIQTPTLRTPAKVASFAIGIAGPEEQRKIKLATPKPIFVHSIFMNAEDFLDGLNISETLDQYLMGSIGIGNRPEAIFINVNYFPGAHQVRGLYTKTNNGYTLNGKIYKDKELKGSFEIEGVGMEDMVPKIAREVENYAFPKDEYKVPQDDEIGLLEKGLKDDLDKIIQKDLMDLMYGYKENFIGEKFKVPMPKLHADHLKDLAYLLDPKTKSNTKETELKYQYYSTVHNKKRKFPFFAACNLNGSAFLTAGRNGVFVTDPRIAKEDQCGDELYTFKYKGKAYTEFCHRGHMSKREDPQWADKANLKIYYKSDPPADAKATPEKRDKAVLTSIAERGARLTFFFTNAIPQHGHLNGVVWRSLEDYIMAVATNNKKAQGPDLYKINIITGPVFQDNDPVFPLNNEGGKANGKKNGLQIPTLFWKVVYFTKDDGKLYHVGFLMGQAELLKWEFERLDGLKAKDIKAMEKETEPPFEGYKNKAVFQVKISFIETLTKLKFHPAIDPYKDSRPAKEIIEKVQLAKKELVGEDDEPGYSLDGLSI